MKTNRLLNFSLIILLMLAVCFVQPISTIKWVAAEQNVNVSDSLTDGLKRNSLLEMSDKRLTIRQPIMEVLERNLTRKTPEVLSNTFYLPNFETREETNAMVVFNGYPSTSNGAALSNFEKYMLLRQVKYYNQFAMADAEAGTLKKHPAADGQYGALEVKNNAVKKRIVLDPIYKSNLTTGLYLPAGETITVSVSGLKQGESIRLVTHLQSTGAWVVGNSEAEYFNTYDNLIIEESKKDNPNYESLEIPLHSQYARGNELIPAIATSFRLSENKTYKLGTPFGGSLFIRSENITSSPEVVITGAVETPHFILGVTTKEEFETNLRNAPGLIASLDTENGVMVGPSVYMRNTDDIEKVAYLWHSIFTINTSFNGRAYNTQTIVKFNFFIPAGAAVAIGNSAVCPSGWMSDCMNYSKFIHKGSWGVLHEIGHIHANAYGKVWGMNGSQEGEVRNNTLIVLAYTMLLNMDSRMVGVEHGEVTHPYLSLQKMLNINLSNKTDFNEYEYFEALSLYANLIHAFGPDKFIEFFYTYKTNPKFCNNSRADFAYRMALTNNFNIVPWLNEFYKANITNEMFSAEQLTKLNSLKSFYPVALSFANGVNSLETARRQEISFNNPTTWDLTNKILCPVNFEITEITKPKYGTISVNENIITYTPPKNVVAGDEFNVVVKLETGVIVKLPVRFWFNFNYSDSKVWKNTGISNNIEKAIEYSKTIEPTLNETSSTAGYNVYNSGANSDYINTTFKFVAPMEGNYKFYLKSDDIGKVEAGFSPNENAFSISTKSYTANYNKNNFFEVKLKQNESLYFTTHLVNGGGQGFLKVGVSFPNFPNTIVDIPKENIYSYDFSNDLIMETKNFGWKPKYFQSIKNFTKKNYLQKDGWQMIEVPVSQGTIDPHVLIDGNKNTYYHSKYSPNSGITPMPHNYILDMGTINQVNFFEVSTRNNVNSYVNKFELYGSVDNKNYVLLSSGDKLGYSNLTATISFDPTLVRYFKFVALTATGGNFTVISEFGTGIKGEVKNIIKPNSALNSYKGFVQSNGSGEIVSNKSGSIFNFKFSGTGFNLFSNTGKNFGSATIYIDNENAGQISLVGEPSINNLVYTINNLSNSEHDIKIVTDSNNPFHIGYLSINYNDLALQTKLPSENAISPPVMALIIIVSTFAVISIILIIITFSKKHKPKKSLYKNSFEEFNSKINKDYLVLKDNKQNKQGTIAKNIINKNKK